MAGIKAAAEGEHAVALDHFDWAISAEPDQPYNYLGRAGSKAVMGDREVSTPSLPQCIISAPPCPAPLMESCDGY